ncbi:MAG: GGDEF domain-containing protein [Planctomycetota bacterium]|nr:GGDEF domain-containing protein [Planctomycetota bacterium]
MMGICEAILSYLARLGSFWTNAILLFVTVMVAILDYLTGDQLSLYVFYFPIISIAAWLQGFRTAVVLALISSVLWIVDDIIAPFGPFPDIAHYWDALVRFSMLAAFAYVLSKLRDAMERERSLASHDGLTGLANRQMLFDLGTRELARCSRRGAPISAIFIDCDGFKAVNDQLGHATGDLVLQVIARSLLCNCRPTDVVSRLGGDEFVLIISEVPISEMKQFASRLREELLMEMRRNGWSVTFSMGVATYAIPPDSIEQLVDAADSLMYMVKHDEKDSIKMKVLDSAEMPLTRIESPASFPPATLA